MKRERLATILTAGVLAVALGITVAKSRGWTLADVRPAAIAQSFRPKVIAPEDALYSMLDAAKAGDVNAYLGCYTGHMKELLQQSATEATADKFKSYLQTSNASIQGVALSPPENVSDSQVKVRVEYVYRDRNEVQFVYMKKEPPTWRIYQVDGAERIKTLVPYGSPVTD
jgi:hypothetical protein